MAYMRSSLTGFRPVMKMYDKLLPKENCGETGEIEPDFLGY